MDLGGQNNGVSKTGAESASASNSPSEEVQQASLSQMRGGGTSEGSHRTGPSPAELTGALGSFLKRTSQLEESSGPSRFSAMFRDLKSDDGTRQIMALTELSEYLSFSSEEALISFPMETFIPVLISLLEDPGHSDETAAQAMMLCCRCLFNVVDILPPTTRIITAAGGLPVLCANLLNVAYIDVAELAVAIIERISEDQPLQVLKAGGLQAILTFLDFFQLAVQRQAVNAAALMLLPIPPSDVFEQHIRPVLPNLVTLLQHADPQVLQSICECWRRLLDNSIMTHSRPKSSSLSVGPSSSIGRMVAKGKWRGPGERLKKEKGEEVSEAIGSSGSSSPTSVASFLEEMCPSSILSNLLVLLSNGISAPSPHTSIVIAEVLYILAVLTNYSDAFTREALKQDVCVLLRQMVLAMDLVNGGHVVTQTSFSLLRVLAAVASILPAIQLCDVTCKCEEKRLLLFKENPIYLDALSETFLPVLVNVYEASMDPSIQSLCITLLLAFFLSCRDRPDIVRRSLEPTRVACFLANLLLAGASKSVMLACLLIVFELLENHPVPYSLLFVRHGVVRAIHRLVTHEDEPQRRARVPNKTEKKQRSQTVASPKATSRSRAQVLEEAAHRVLSSYFASSSHTGESAILRALGKIAKQLRCSPQALIAAHREALTKLHDLVLAADGITAFEFTCSGTASALSAFLYPIANGANFGSATDMNAAYHERLRLFLECIGKSSDGAFVKLVRLCVSAVQRIEQQPLTLFPTHASLMAALPPHLRSNVPSLQGSGKGDGSPWSRGGFGLGGDFPPGFGSRMGGRGHDAGPYSSPSLSVLRLLAKPVRVRMSPHGSASAASSSNNPLPNFRTLLMPFGGKAAPPRFPEAKHSSPATPSSSPPKAAQQAELAQLTSTSPAARLRNYLASKVSRKRTVASTGMSASSATPAEKRSGVTGLLSKAEAKPPPKPADDSWPSSGSWDADDDCNRSADLGNMAPSSAAPGGASSSRSSADRASPRERDEHSRAPDREREIFGEVVEAVLLVEPLASMSALEEYIWEKHGPKMCAAQESGSLKASNAGTEGSAAGSSASTGLGSTQSVPQSSSSEAVARVRLSTKQPAAATPRERHGIGHGTAEGPDGNSPRTPLAVLEPDVPPTLDQATGPQQARQRKRVQIYLNGQLLTPKTSVVQALVNNTTRLPRGRSAQDDCANPHCRADRFLVSTEEASSSEVDDSADSASLSAHVSSRHFCGAIWGRVHSMTYEIVDELPTSGDAEVSTSSLVPEGPAVIVATEFDTLIQRHGKVAGCIASLQSHTATSPGAGAMAEPDEAAQSALTPRSAGSRDEGESPNQAAVDQEALATMLQLLSAFYHQREYLLSSQGMFGIDGLVTDDDFQCNSLTSKLLRQLSDPLAICTGSIPPWCTKLAGACRFLFPYSARRVLHHSCNLGLSRALQHVQQRTLSQNAHSQEMQRRLEGEVAVANIPRQKVRISRQRILESAIKVMNLYGTSNTILEVEYVGEVGTGSGPTLEFYAQVADILRTAEPLLFRPSVPGGMLFPEPWSQKMLQEGNDQATQILERFRLLGHLVAKCILDSRLVDLQLHPAFWSAVLGGGPFSQNTLRDIDPELFTSMKELRNMDDKALSQLCIDFTLPGRPQIELLPDGLSTSLSKDNVEDYINRVTEVSLVSAVALQVAEFRKAFTELLPLETLHIWSGKELASIIQGSSVRDDACWTLEHLSAHLKAQHGYTSQSRCFRDLLNALAELKTDDRRKFLTFTTGAPTLPVGGFAGLKPPLTVVKKEAPPAPLTPDQFMPSVMTCANYLKLPEYSSAEILRQKLDLAMNEGQSAFLLS